MLEIEAAPNNIVEITNSPDIKPKMPVVKKKPVRISLYRLFDLFIFCLACVQLIVKHGFMI